VVSNLLTVLRGVLLAVRAVDTNLTEQTFHTESTRFVSDDRYQVATFSTPPSVKIILWVST
ncbi:hypothetical protein MJM04_29700, partial [Salmonella enterica subsp. enterica serovar Cerro]|nr:hypothetical protein [Salmonella enterica subsp. enterica serovar Cerro]